MQVDREATTLDFQFVYIQEEELPPITEASSSFVSWRPRGVEKQSRVEPDFRSGEVRCPAKEVDLRKRECDGDEAENESPWRMVTSFNQITSEMLQKARDEQTRKLCTNHSNTDEYRNVKAKFVEPWNPKILQLEPNS